MKGSFCFLLLRRDVSSFVTTSPISLGTPYAIMHYARCDWLVFDDFIYGVITWILEIRLHWKVFYIRYIEFLKTIDLAGLFNTNYSTFTWDPKWTQTGLRFYFKSKISLRCNVTSLLAFTWIQAKWNSLRRKFHFGQFDQSKISNRSGFSM